MRITPKGIQIKLEDLRAFVVDFDFVEYVLALRTVGCFFFTFICCTDLVLLILCIPRELDVFIPSCAGRD